MKKLFAFLLAGIMAFSMVGCGEIETIGGETAKNFSSSPEVNVEDTYYTKVLEDCPFVLLNHATIDSLHIRVKNNLLYASKSFNESRFNSDNVLPKVITYEEYVAVFNEKDFVTIEDEDTYKANPSAYIVPESVQNRQDWETKNNFYFCNDPLYYLNNLEEYDYFTPNGLAVVYYYGDKLAEERFQQTMIYNPYFSGKTGNTNVPELKGIYSYDTACKNLETEKAELINTITKYLEQKYKGVDNGIEFSDYMLNHTTFEDVQKFISSQKLKDVEITVNAAHANLLTFHPFVDIEYTLTANGEDKLMHEVYFLEVDKADNGEFVFKVAYVADYGEDSKFSYTKFREGEYAVGENFNWDPLKDICVANNGKGGKSASAYGLAEMY